MNDRIEGLLSVVLTVAALGIGASVVHREFIAKPQEATVARGAAPTREAQFAQARAAGVLIGKASARVQIVEFSDLECPSCRGFHAEIEPVLKEYPDDVALTFVHFPLSQHRFALPAARAADCALSFGRFHEFVRAVFEKQDSLGLKSWGSYATDAAIVDTTAISACASASANPGRVERGRALGRQMQIDGTPTVMVNGWRFNRTPSAADLRAAVAQVRAGKEPMGLPAAN